MATITKQFLSHSTQGRGIKVTTTASDGTGDGGLSTGNPIHAAVSGTTDIDEVWLWASNAHTSAITLTIEHGGTTGISDTIVTTVAASSTELVVPGLIIQNGLDIRAFAATANQISVFGGASSLVNVLFAIDLTQAWRVNQQHSVRTGPNDFPSTNGRSAFSVRLKDVAAGKRIE